MSGDVQKNLNLARQASKRVSCEAIKEYVDRHLYSADLSPLKAAQALGISQRYLHKIFAESGSTFCQYIHRRRLELSREKLADPNASIAPSATSPWNWAFTTTPTSPARSARLTA